MRSALLLVVYVAYLVLGTSAAFVMALGYVWTDIFGPQYVSYAILSSIPVSMIMGVATLGMYLTTDRRSPPRITWQMVMILIFTVWVTMTTTWAVVPENAWFKWNAAVKTLLFAIFIPFLFRSRVQLEALILTIIFALLGHMMSYSIKTALTGGGYGHDIGLVHDQVGLVGETSTLAFFSVAIIPLLMFLKEHSLIIPRFRHTNLAYNMVALAAVFTALGTFARTGLVSLAVLGGLLWLRSKRKVVVGLGLFFAGAVTFMAMSETWLNRMSTILHPTEDSSAGGRIMVWKWTWEYAKTHPLGGGFNNFFINSYTMHLPDGTEIVQHGRAYHSIYFEVLGEHGYVGLAMFAVLMAGMFWMMLRIRRKTRALPDLRWLHDMMGALITTTIIYMCGGAFESIAFRSPLYFLMAIVIAGGEYYRRAVQPVSTGWRRVPAPQPVSPRPLPLTGRTGMRPSVSEPR